MKPFHLPVARLLLMPVFAGATLAQQGTAGLAGTSWQLVQFQGGDDTILKPAARGQYTLAFDETGTASVRADCNRGRGTWKSSSPPHLQFGPMALTRAICPAAPLNNRLPRDFESVRSYILRNGHLFLSLMADGGIYEWEPMEQKTAGASVKGTATFRERMALPAGAVLEVTLEDVSKADAESRVVGHARVERPGNPPIPFEISYDPARIDQKHRYTVRGRILVHGKLIFNTTQAYSVLTGGNGREVQLVLQRTGGTPPPAGAAALEHQQWNLTRIDGRAVTLAPRQKKPYLVFDPKEGRVSGTGGCNRVTGNYQVNGSQLKLGQMAGTMMACMQGMETEQAMMRALNRVVSFQIEGQTLELRDTAGKSALSFAAGQPE